MVSDEQWMELAIAEARKGVGTTSPNPPVGAVIVKNDTLLGCGWHRKAGEPHAEREAIANVTNEHGSSALREATIYVTLEPCSTRGRTPACTDGIIEAGISRVVYGSTDPNPAHVGRADSILSSAGIDVSRLKDTSACDKLIRPFTKVQRTGLPWVILKSAMSLDGRVTRPPGESQWLTSTESRCQSSGTITVNASGGNTPYLYEIIAEIQLEKGYDYSINFIFEEKEIEITDTYKIFKAKKGKLILKDEFNNKIKLSLNDKN